MSAPHADDYYAMLGVPSGADGDELRRAWHKLVLRWHPDRAGAAATAAFQQLQAAYAVLSDPIARIAYDRRRASDPGAQRSSTAPGPPSRPSRRPAPAVMLQRISGPLTSLLACGAARLDEPGFITLVLSEREAAEGGMATVSLPVDLWCPDCAPPERPGSCGRCGGSGKVRELFSAWLSVPPAATTGEVLAPSVELPGMVEPVRFRVQLHGH